ncbi:MAG: conjugal transfer protein TraH [Maricaulaceae bacterium]
MDSFYDKSKNSYVSSTKPGAYSSQSRHALTGGSYVWRAPQENATILSASLPSIKAGCGGIDIFGGSFSFINGEQIEALFRAILQDAAGYAFMLALEEISPIIAGNVKSLQDMINKVNGQNINSCEAAEALVDNAIGAINGSLSTTCAVQGTANSIFPDALAGKSCGDQTPSSVVAGAQAADPALELPVNQNYAMKATEDAYFASDFDLREFYMTLTGTLVITVADGPPQYNYVSPINLDESVVRSLMSGGIILGHECRAITIGPKTYPKEDCIDVGQFTNNIDVPADKGFLIRVENILGSIYDKAAGDNDEALTDQEIAFIEDTPLPIYRAGVLFSQTHPEVGKSMLLGYSELIAYSITLKFLEQTSREVLNGSQQNPAANKTDLIQWRETVNRNISELSRQQSKLQARFSAVQSFVSQMEKMESSLAGKINSNILRTASSSQRN